MSVLFYKFVSLDFKINHPDEPWVYSEEPHSSRRKEILKKYPEIKKLMGYDPWMAFYISLTVVAQIYFCWLIQDLSWGAVFLWTYIVSGTLNHSLGSAIHEIGHNLAFGHSRPLWNRALGFFCNLPLGIPMSISYKRYHADHHRYMGHEIKDVDVPSHLEYYLFRNPFTKLIWVIIYPIIQVIRPFCKSPKPVGVLEIVNFITQITFNLIMYQLFGVKAIFYLVFGTLLGLGLHPISGHFISEHYLFTKGQATMSYYGPLNYITYNLGYHIEHHDFPYIPYSRIKKVREIAPEFYDLPHHTSWCKVIWDFIFDEDMGPKARGVGYLEYEVGKLEDGQINQYSEHQNGISMNGEKKSL